MVKIGDFENADGCFKSTNVLAPIILYEKKISQKSQIKDLKNDT